GESRRLLPRHSCGDEFAAEASHAPLPFRLEAHEADADLHRQDRDGRHDDEREAVVVAGHHSLPAPRLPMAFEKIPARFRDDMYCSDNLNACSSVIPLSFSVRSKFATAVPNSADASFP